MRGRGASCGSCIDQLHGECRDYSGHTVASRVIGLWRGKIGCACRAGVNVGGEGEIRTHEPREGLPVFKTGAFNRSATSPFVSQALGVPGRPSGSAARPAR